MASKLSQNESERHLQDNNFFDIQTSFSINQMGSTIEKETKEYLGIFIIWSVKTLKRRNQF